MTYKKKSKNILIVSSLYNPEIIRVNDLVDYLIQKNNKVTVLCSIPNYPQGKYYKNYGIFKKRYEKIDNLKIVRVLVYPRKNGSKINLFLNYLSFIIFSIIPAIILSFQKFDLVFVNQLSPITVAIPGIIVKKIKRIPMIMWVTDLWPESIKDAGNLKSDFIPNLILPIVRYIYRNCDQILVTSKGFISSINQKIKYKEITYVPQWGEEIFTKKNNDDFIYEPMEKIKDFKILFAGNIGIAQDIDSVISAINAIKDYKVHLVILGDGRAKKDVMKKIKAMNLESKVSLFGSFPLEAMPYFFNKADALLISLKKSDIFSRTIPGKTQAYMPSGKPILTNADGEISRIINEAQCGLTANSGDYKTLSKNIIKLSNQSQFELKSMGDNGKKYYKNNFNREKILNNFEEIIHNTIDNKK
jgi:glycosyltransferase involved in cell wall biosynthesis